MMNNQTYGMILAECKRRYQALGLKVTGSFYFLGPMGHFSMNNYVLDQNEILCSSGSISNDEGNVLYEISQALEPKRILIIGNAYGFSTILLSLMNPTSKLIAFDKFRQNGIKVTNQLLHNSPQHIAIQGSTPEDIGSIIENYLDGSCDLVLIDAVHTNEMQKAEFEILKSYLSEKSIIVFHDVLSCNLLESWDSISRENNNMKFFLISKSVSGVGLALKGEYSVDLLDYLTFLSPALEETYQLVDFFQKQRFNDGIFSSLESTVTSRPHPQN